MLSGYTTLDWAARLALTALAAWLTWHDTRTRRIPNAAVLPMWLGLLAGRSLAGGWWLWLVLPACGVWIVLEPAWLRYAALAVYVLTALRLPLPAPFTFITLAWLFLLVLWDNGRIIDSGDVKVGAVVLALFPDLRLVALFVGVGLVYGAAVLVWQSGARGALRRLLAAVLRLVHLDLPTLPERERDIRRVPGAIVHVLPAALYAWLYWTPRSSPSAGLGLAVALLGLGGMALALYGPALKRRLLSFQRQRPAGLVAGEKGQNSIELVFVILITSMLLFGAFSLGQGLAVKQALDVGVAKAARGLSLRPYDWTWADTTVRNEVDANILGGSYGASVALEITDDTGAPLTPGQLSSLPFGAEFHLRGSIPFQVIVPFLPGLSGRTITVEHIQLVERYP